MAELMETMTVVRTEPGGSWADAARTIDLVHLARMTLGDRGLEREVLQLFARQSVQLVERMRTAPPDAVAMLAHTLKGSARGIGACRVAAAADVVERASAGTGPGLPAALATLAEAVEDARSVVGELLRTQ
ncbi:MAG TPA: Hpt domain-containing protein [Xanthobacteraceae bacterium]|jgi:HPt (histidine-containing phosphotransfer) domain-containing protein